jgi:glycosyltransferase involved in cell wall biosynthesis
VKIAISTICPHIYFEGRWWSYEPFVLEMNVWAQLFDELIMIAPVEQGPAPAFWAPYADAANISLVPYRRDKGRGLKQARSSILEVPMMVAAIVKGVRRARAVHVRCPGSIGLVSALLVPLLGRRMCAKYAGQWGAYPGEAMSVRLQRAILRSPWWRGPVTVYGRNANDPAKIVSFFTSSLSPDNLTRAKAAAHQKPKNPLRVLYVGRLSAAKNVDMLVSAVAQLVSRQIPIECLIVGDGSEKQALESRVRAQHLGKAITFAGGLTFNEVLSCYEQADVLVLMSQTEGWPKVIAEAMAFGLICIGSDRGLIPEMLGEGRGIVIPPGDVEALATALQDISAHPANFESMRLLGATWASQYSLESLRDALRDLLSSHWGIPFGNSGQKTKMRPADANV